MAKDFSTIVREEGQASSKVRYRNAGSFASQLKLD
jgi:hypothetical protein